MLTHFLLSENLALQHRQNRYRQLHPITQGVTPNITVDDQVFVNFCSNDYLGLASHPSVIDGISWASQQLQQVGSGASHLVTGHHHWHDVLAQHLASATGYEKALTFSTGYMANLAVLQVLCHQGTVIFSDRLNHASIIDGGLLSQSKLIFYPHQNYDWLEKKLQQTDCVKKVIVSDHVFSMDGTLADLQRLKSLAERYECALIIDDAHGFGLPYQAKNLADVYIGTLGKAIGTFGAFVASSAVFIDYLINFARTYIYTTAMPPALAYATQIALTIAQTDSKRQQQFQQNIQQMYDGLVQQGWQIGINQNLLHPQTAIIPILIKDNQKAVQLSEMLKQQGFWVSAIRPPSVPPNTARLRICVSANHQPQQIDDFLWQMANMIV